MRAPKALSFNPLAAVLLGAPPAAILYGYGGSHLGAAPTKSSYFAFPRTTKQDLYFPEKSRRQTHPTCKGKFFLEKKAADRPTPLSSEIGADENSIFRVPANCPTALSRRRRAAAPMKIRYFAFPRTGAENRRQPAGKHRLRLQVNIPGGQNDPSSFSEREGAAERRSIKIELFASPRARFQRRKGGPSPGPIAGN
ncbi:hypothetical protein DFH09DRAFT_1079132 [Mycena vulgaris]|nr:hypothetical protein DFH09DRAFT_1079132 [Mycena vulgaris]